LKNYYLISQNSGKKTVGKEMRYRWLFAIYVAIILSCTKVSGQDPQFSQFYAAPLYLNPALTGSTQLTRIGVNYRNQWPSIPVNFINYSFYADHYFIDANSGVGLLVNSDLEGMAGLRSQSISLFYAYQLHLTRSWTFRAGFQGSYFIRDLNYSKLTFGDQFDETGQIKAVTSDVFSSNWKVTFPDMSLGGVFYNKNLWVGLSVHHITQPDMAFLDQDQSILPRKYSIHAGYKINIQHASVHHIYHGHNQRAINMYPVINYKRQGPFEQLDAGFYFDTDPVLIGLWYRGIPFKKFEDFNKNEALIFMIGLSTNGFNIGYSFDYTLSAIGIASGGAHEISISYHFFSGNPRKPPRSVRIIPCPKL
jgi:type IX secretion system PorP/SprF family membrane protein